MGFGGSKDVKADEVAAEAKLPPHERTASRLKRLHGIEIPAEAFLVPSAEATQQKIEKLERELVEARATLQQGGEPMSVIVTP